MVFFKNKFLFFHIWKEYSGFLVNCVVLVAKSYPTLLWPPWATAHQVPLSMGFPRREYWSGLPFPSPGDLPKPGIEPKYLALAGRFFITEPPGSPSGQFTILQNLLSVKELRSCWGKKWQYIYRMGNVGPQEGWGYHFLYLPLLTPSPNIPKITSQLYIPRVAFKWGERGRHSTLVCRQMRSL